MGLESAGLTGSDESRKPKGPVNMPPETLKKMSKWPFVQTTHQLSLIRAR
jgi:hypothetical protein